MTMLLAESLVRYQLLPIHHNQGAKVRKIPAVYAHFAEINEKIKKLGIERLISKVKAVPLHIDKIYFKKC